MNAFRLYAIDGGKTPTKLGDTTASQEGRIHAGEIRLPEPQGLPSQEKLKEAGHTLGLLAGHLVASFVGAMQQVSATPDPQPQARKELPAAVVAAVLRHAKGVDGVREVLISPSGTHVLLVADMFTEALSDTAGDVLCKIQEELFPDYSTIIDGGLTDKEGNEIAYRGYIKVPLS